RSPAERLDALRRMLLGLGVRLCKRDAVLVFQEQVPGEVALDRLPIFELGDRQTDCLVARRNVAVAQAKDTDVEVALRYVRETALDKRLLARAIAMADDACVAERAFDRFTLVLE